MRRRLCKAAGIAVLMLIGAYSITPAAPQDSKAGSGPLSGSWQCTSRGGPEGETAFTLDLSQEGDKLTGSVASAQGGMEISSASFKDNTLEIHLDTPDGNYVLTARLKDGKLTDGQTTLDGKAHSTWEGKKAVTAEGKSGG
jgi:hypothetical protein